MGIPQCCWSCLSSPLTWVTPGLHFPSPAPTTASSPPRGRAAPAGLLLGIEDQRENQGPHRGTESSSQMGTPGGPPIPCKPCHTHTTNIYHIHHTHNCSQAIHTLYSADKHTRHITHTPYYPKPRQMERGSHSGRWENSSCQGNGVGEGPVQKLRLPKTGQGGSPLRKHRGLDCGQP